MKLRSWLCCSVLNEDFVEQSILYHPDVLHFDLEDSIPPSLKDQARLKLAEHFETVNRKALSVATAIRINDIVESCGHDDISFLLDKVIYPDVLIIPKHLLCKDCGLLDKYLNSSPINTLVFSIVESVHSLVHLKTFQKVNPHVSGIILGTADLSQDFGISPFGLDTNIIKYDMSLYAKHFGLILIDSPCFDLSDTSILTKQVLESRKWGFEGKIVIHPNHIEPVNELMLYSSKEIEFAQEILESFDNNQKSVIRVGSKMVGPPMVAWAQRLIKSLEEVRNR